MADLKLQRQQEKAAVKIQARARGKQDRSHAQQKLVNLHVWLLNLFDHMACKHTKKVDVGLLAGYIQSDPSVLQKVSPQPLRCPCIYMHTAVLLLLLRMLCVYTKTHAGTHRNARKHSHPHTHTHQLNLPRRLMRLPAMLLTKSFDFVRGFELNPSAYPSRLDWPGVARVFEISDAEVTREGRE